MLWVFLTTRVLHILCAAIWLGATILLSFFLVPTLEEVGPSSGKVLAGLQRRGLMAFMPTIGGLTILSGAWLYWRYTGGFDRAMSGTTGAMVFGTGGILGLIALIIGASVVGRSAKKSAMLAAKVQGMPAGAEQQTLHAQIRVLEHRAGVFGKVVALLLLVSMALMALGHYV